MRNHLLGVNNVSRIFGRGDKPVHALRDVTLTLYEGETLAIVGESGSGKTTLANMVLGLDEPSHGEIEFRGERLRKDRNPELRRAIQLVQQNPTTTLNPRRTIEQSVGLALDVHRLGTRAERRARIVDLLETVGLGADYLTRVPAQLSGGQRQRVAIARALAASPELVVLDEPTSALDVSVQAKVLALLRELQQQEHLTYMFITHDLGVVRNVSDRVAVFYRGRIVEAGRTEAIFARPRHPYTRMLFASIPVVSEAEAALKPQWDWDKVVDSRAIAGDGCPFRPRCPYATARCGAMPSLDDTGDGHTVACFAVDTGNQDGSRD
ncbi:ABC transporter ATP-binding protein [Burkholderia sp. PU8-34]